MMRQYLLNVRTDWALGGALGLLLIGCGEEQMQGVDPGPCQIETIEAADEGAQHVPEGTTLSSRTNPPASGAHYPYWGRWGAHQAPLARGYWLHNLEHGGVAMLYRCDANCALHQTQLAELLARLPGDSACAAPIRTRVVLTADALLETPIAVVAWQKVYRATCVDAASIEAFVRKNLGHGPESTCAEGQIP